MGLADRVPASRRDLPASRVVERPPGRVGSRSPPADLVISGPPFSLPGGVPVSATRPRACSPDPSRFSVRRRASPSFRRLRDLIRLATRHRLGGAACRVWVGDSVPPTRVGRGCARVGRLAWIMAHGRHPRSRTWASTCVRSRRVLAGRAAEMRRVCCPRCDRFERRRGAPRASARGETLAPRRRPPGVDPHPPSVSPHLHQRGAHQARPGRDHPRPRRFCRPVRFLLYLSSLELGAHAPYPMAPAGVCVFASALEDLGPIFVKFGQIILHAA